MSDVDKKKVNLENTKKKKKNITKMLSRRTTRSLVVTDYRRRLTVR